MKNLYGTISINKKLGNTCIKENIHYYKLKNSKYGFEIVKESTTDDEKFEVKDVTDNEEKINRVLYDLVIKQIMPNSEDIIEDLIKTYAC